MQNPGGIKSIECERRDEIIGYSIEVPTKPTTIGPKLERENAESGRIPMASSPSNAPDEIISYSGGLHTGFSDEVLQHETQRQFVRTFGFLESFIRRSAFVVWRAGDCMNGMALREDTQQGSPRCLTSSVRRSVYSRWDGEKRPDSKPRKDLECEPFLLPS